MSQDGMKLGHGIREITPDKPLALSGFVARCNARFQSVDDPLFVRCLVFRTQSETIALFSFDLLAIGEELHRRLLTAIHHEPEQIGCIFTTTHTHSAPATIELLGCGEMDSDYLDKVSRAAVEAYKDAAASLRWVSQIRFGTLDMAGLSYNRRRILASGRVSMSYQPKEPFTCSETVQDDLHILCFVDQYGNHIAAITEWAAHALLQDTLNVSADFPGLLCSLFDSTFDLPTLYLQGACADVNPCFSSLGRDSLLAFVDDLNARLREICWDDICPADTLRFGQHTIDLEFRDVFDLATLERIITGMGEIAEHGEGPPEQVKVLADILNIAPGESAPDDMLRYTASILKTWAEHTRDKITNGDQEQCSLNVATLEVGNVTLVFVAAEVFQQTSRRIEQLFPGQKVIVVAYAAPLVGYLPPADALEQGGYEAEYAYRFYNHIAAFNSNWEQPLLDAVRGLSGA